VPHVHVDLAVFVGEDGRGSMGCAARSTVPLPPGLSTTLDRLMLAESSR